MSIECERDPVSFAVPWFVTQRVSRTTLASSSFGLFSFLFCSRRPSGKREHESFIRMMIFDDNWQNDWIESSSISNSSYQLTFIPLFDSIRGALVYNRFRQIIVIIVVFHLSIGNLSPC